jgi:probable rRNA maturation factor
LTIHFTGIRKFSKKNTLLKFVRSVCRQEARLNQKGEICFIFVTDKQIRIINRKFLKQDYPTDVIAFNYSMPMPKTKDTPFGDIYISLDTARSAARLGKYPVYQEIALLMLHGLLHLIGYEDHTHKKQKKMFARQRELFRKIDQTLAPPDLDTE